MPEANTWLVRSRYIAQASAGDGRFLLCHILARSRVTCDRAVIDLLDSFRRPMLLGALLDEQGEGAPSLASLISQLRDLSLLRVAGNDEPERIRDVYRLRLREPSTFVSLRVADELEVPELTLSLGSRLVLSSNLAVLSLSDGELLMTHPLGSPVHLSGRLGALARAFVSPATVSEILAQQGGEDATEYDLLHACGFLYRRKLLWPSEEAERQAVRASLPSTANGSLAVSYPPTNRWRQKFQAYELSDVRRTLSTGSIALIGPCQVQQLSESLELFAQRRGRFLELHGFLSPEPALSLRAWSLVVLSSAQYTANLYEALAAEDTDRCLALVPGVVSQIDHAVDQIRQHTKAPLLVTSLGLPGLWSTPPTSPFGFFAHHLFATLNQKILECISGQGDVDLLDEPRQVSESDAGLYWDDAFNALPHHAALSTWSWVTLKRGVTDAPYTEAQRRSLLPTPPSHQADPSAVLSDAIVHALERREARPVRLLIFEPNELLWRGKIEEHLEALTDPHFYADVEEYRYAGLHEALSLLRQRGLLLACLSSTPVDSLRARWRFGDRLRHAVRIEDMSAIEGGADASIPLAKWLSPSYPLRRRTRSVSVCRTTRKSVQLLHLSGHRSPTVRRNLRFRRRSPIEIILQRTKMQPEDALLLGVTPPDHFRGRIYRGDPWALRRYLLTAPELWPLSAPKKTSLSSEEAPPIEAEAPASPEETVRRVVLEQLKASAFNDTEDLRLLGLDSIGGLSLMQRLEDALQIRFEDQDFVEPVLFFLSPLIAAVRRALQRRAAGAYAPVANRESLYQGLSYEAWCQQDLPSLIHRHFASPPSPWLYKFVHSGARFDHRYLTWRELERSAGGYAALYQEMGLAEGDVVALLLPQGEPLISAFTGAILGRFVPTICPHPNEKLSHGAFLEWFARVIERSGARLLLCEEENAPLLREELHRAGLHVQVWSGAPRGAKPPAPGAPRPEQTAFLQHSSGTTGLKKAILIDHRRVLSQVWELSHSLACSSSDKIASWLPLYHDMGLISSLLLPLTLSLPTTMLSPLDWVKQPELLLEQISSERASLCWMPNFALMHCARRIPERKLVGLDLSSLRVLINGGEPVTSIAHDAFFRRLSPFGLRASALSSGYGAAETTAAITQSTPGRSARRLRLSANDLQENGRATPTQNSAREKSVELISCGPPLSRTVVEAIGEDGAALPDGCVGQLRVKSPSAMSGYLKSPEETAATLRDGWLYPGDLGFLWEGEVFVTGRISDRIIVAGRNFYCHDLEESLSALDGVKAGRVSAFGLFREEEGTEQVVILVESSLNEESAKESLAQKIRAIILGVFGLVVHEVVILEPGALIKSTSGKPSRRKNRELYLQRKERP